MTTTLRLHPRPAYLTLATIAFQRAVAYRMAFFFNMLGMLIGMTVSYYLWKTVYATRAEVGNYDWQMMRTYILVSYALGTLLSWNSLGRIVGTIRTGEVVVELLRPIDYFFAQLAQASGAALVEGGFAALMTLGLALAVFQIAPPTSLLSGLCFGISVVLGFLIRFELGFLVALVCFWTINGLGIMWGYYAVVNLLSGALIPIHLFPNWLQLLARFLPFQAILYTPLSIYLGTVQGFALFEALRIQFLWIILLWLIIRRLWTPATRALEIQGG